MRLKQAILFVKDLPRMTAFYTEVLQTEPNSETRTGSWVVFEAGALSFALHAVPAQIAEQIEIPSPPAPRDAVPVKLIFEAEDVSAESRRLGALGVTIRERPWGAFDAVDPEGNIFTISG